MRLSSSKAAFTLALTLATVVPVVMAQQPYGSPQQPYGAPQQPYGAPQQPYGAPQQPRQTAPYYGQAAAGQFPGQAPGGPIMGQPQTQQFLLPQGQQGPIVVPPIAFVDVNSGRFGKLEIDLERGEFLNGSADNLHLIARDMDLNRGELKSLFVEVKGGHLQDFIFDNLTMSTSGSLNFDPGILFNHKTLQFSTPAQAEVTATITQESLNKFLNAPRTLDRLSVTANQKAGLLANVMGANAPTIGITVSGATLALGKQNRVNLKVDGKVGVGQFAMPVPLEVTSQLALESGWVQVTDTHLKTAGQEISPVLSEMLVKKINALSAYGQKSDDIKFVFTDLKVSPGKQFVLKGTAEVSRLRFGRT